MTADIYKDKYGRTIFVDQDKKEWVIGEKQKEDRRKLLREYGYD